MRQQQDPQQFGEKERFSDRREPGVAGVVSNAYSAIRQQITVASSELSYALGKFRIGIGALALGAGLVLIGSALIPFLLVDLVRYLSGNQIPAWAAFGAVALLFIAIGVGVVSYSLARFWIVGDDFSDALSEVGRVGDDLKSDLHSRVTKVEGAVKSRVEDLRNFFDISHQVNERPWAVVGTAVLGGLLLRRLFALTGDADGDLPGSHSDQRSDRKGRAGQSAIVQQLRQQIDQNTNLFVRAGVGLLIALAKKGFDTRAQGTAADSVPEEGGSPAGSQTASQRALRAGKAPAEASRTTATPRQPSTNSPHGHIRGGERTIH